jgi:hypothetical protein
MLNSQTFRHLVAVVNDKSFTISVKTVSYTPLSPSESIVLGSLEEAVAVVGTNTKYLDTVFLKLSEGEELELSLGQAQRLAKRIA